MHVHKFRRLNDRQIFCEVDGDVRTVGYAPYQTGHAPWVIWPYPYIHWGNGPYWTADTGTTTTINWFNAGGASAEGRQVTTSTEGQKVDND